MHSWPKNWQSSSPPCSDPLPLKSNSNKKLTPLRTLCPFRGEPFLLQCRATDFFRPRKLPETDAQGGIAPDKVQDIERCTGGIADDGRNGRTDHVPAQHKDHDGVHEHQVDQHSQRDGGRDHQQKRPRAGKGRDLSFHCLQHPAGDPEKRTGKVLNRTTR